MVSSPSPPLVEVPVVGVLTGRLSRSSASSSGEGIIRGSCRPPTRIVEGPGTARLARLTAVPPPAVVVAVGAAACGRPLLAAEVTAAGEAAPLTVCRRSACAGPHPRPSESRSRSALVLTAWVARRARSAALGIGLTKGLMSCRTPGGATGERMPGCCGRRVAGGSPPPAVPAGASRRGVLAGPSRLNGGCGRRLRWRTAGVLGTEVVGLSVVLLPAELDSVEPSDISRSPRSDVSALELRMLTAIRTDSGSCVLATLVGHSHDVVMFHSREVLLEERLTATPRRVAARMVPLLLLAARRRDVDSPRDDRVGVSGSLCESSLFGADEGSNAFALGRFGAS